jgi:hypothetical protein
LPNLSTMVNGHRLEGGVRASANYLRVVRSTAIARNLQSRLRVSADGSTLSTEVFRNGAWESAGEPMTLGGDTVVSLVTPPSGLLFDAQGRASAASSITIRNAAGKTAGVSVSLLGAMEITGSDDVP